MAIAGPKAGDVIWKKTIIKLEVEGRKLKWNLLRLISAFVIIQPKLFWEQPIRHDMMDYHVGRHVLSRSSKQIHLQAQADDTYSKQFEV